MLQAEQISKNYEKHLKIIDSYIEDDRKQLVHDMLTKLGENYVMSPASGKS